MTYAALIVNVETAESSDARTRLAAGLAASFGAKLIGIAAEPLVVPPAEDGALTSTATLLAHENERVGAMLAAAGQRFHVALPAGQAEWRSFAGEPATVLVQEARSADLLIIGANGRADAGDVLMRAGRPVLVVPEGVASLEARAVVVGWQDTPQARRAIADALPFLRGAADVLVLEVTGRNRPPVEPPHAALDAVARLLALHGIASRAEARPLREASVADELVRAAREGDADLIIAGGYGHSRLREWAFGGVTRDLLAHCPVCRLLSH